MPDLALAPHPLAPLQIILEMLELRENETARALLRNTEVMQELKVSDWERYRRIEDLLARTYFDARDVRVPSFMLTAAADGWRGAGLRRIDEGAPQKPACIL